MKKLVIGRNNQCDIVIPDTSDIVSRKQAVLAFNFWGKMVLYDTSNNGTYVNGERLENGKGVRVTRKDKVSFARMHDLDWNEVHDPYRRTKGWLVAALLVLLLAGGALTWWLLQPADTRQSRVDDDDDEPKKEQVEKGETKTTVDEPAETKPAEQPQQPAPKKKSTKKKSQQKKDSGEDPADKKVNESTPIVY